LPGGGRLPYKAVFNADQFMFRIGKPKNPDAHRCYLFPGQGRGARKKYRRHMLIALTVGLMFAGVLCGVLWLINQGM
jgi:hypothetical protein